MRGFGFWEGVWNSTLYILTKFFDWDARLKAHLGGANAEIEQIELRLSFGWLGRTGVVGLCLSGVS